MTAALPAIAAGATILGTAVSAVGQIQQGRFQARMAQMNADIAEENAQRAAEAARIDAQDEDFRAREAIGQLVADQAGSGLSLASPSFALARKGEKTQARLNRLRIVQGGEVQRHNFLTRAAELRAQGKMAKRAGVQGAISTTLSGLGSLSGSLVSSPSPPSLAGGRAGRIRARVQTGR